MDDLLLGAALSMLATLGIWAAWCWLRAPLAIEADDAPALDDWMDSPTIARKALVDTRALEELRASRSMLRRVLRDLLERQR